MPRSQRRPRTPKYLHHKASGRAYTYLTEKGRRRMVYLGLWESAESHREYRRVLALHFAGEPVAPRSETRESQSSMTVAGLCARFLLHAETYYRRADGSATGEVQSFVHAFRPLLQLYRDTPVDRFRVTDLEQVRGEMVAVRLSRTTVNSRIRRIRQTFRWGVSKTLVPASIWEELRSLAGLKRGRSPASEPRAKGPVDLEDVARTLPFLSPQVAAMVSVQLATGMRPGEVVAMSMDQIDRSGEVWLYRPRQHKNVWRERELAYPLLEAEQEALQPYLREDDRPLFSPSEAEEQRRAQKHRERMTPQSCGNRPGSNRVERPQRRPGEQYNSRSYGKAIRRACRRAGVAPWSPVQLRKRAATDASEKAGLDAARVVLGHQDERSILHYVTDTPEHAIAVRRRLLEGER